MSDPYDLMADVVAVIRSDRELRECFNRILAIGPSTQQVRVANLLRELRKQNAPEQVIRFVRLLENDKLASVVLEEINR